MVLAVRVVFRRYKRIARDCQVEAGDGAETGKHGSHRGSAPHAALFHKQLSIGRQVDMGAAGWGIRDFEPEVTDRRNVVETTSNHAFRLSPGKMPTVDEFWFVESIERAFCRSSPNRVTF